MEYDTMMPSPPTQNTPRVPTLGSVARVPTPAGRGSPVSHATDAGTQT